MQSKDVAMTQTELKYGIDGISSLAFITNIYIYIYI